MLAGAIWLATRQMRKAWVTYPLTSLVMLLLGFLVVPSVYGIFELRGLGAEGRRVEEFCNAFFSDWLFLSICAFVGVNALSSSRLPVFGGLPIPTSSLVGGRALSLPFALVLNVPAFFLPAFFLDPWGLGASSYLWFAGMWVGYGLLASGIVLLIGLTAGGSSCVPASVCLGIQLVLALAVLEWSAGFGIVDASAGLARDHGALAAALSLLVGAAAFAILSRATAELLRKGDISS